MNTESKLITAVDIGTTKIVAMIARQSANGKMQVLGMGEAPSLGVRRGLVVNLEKTIESIRMATDIAETQANIKMKDVFVGIAGMHIHSIRNRGYIIIDPRQDGITQHDVDRLISEAYRISVEPGDEILHILPQRYIVDNEPVTGSPVGMLGNRLEADFHIVFSKASSVLNIKKCIARSGLNTIDVCLEPLASSEAVLTEDEKMVGVAMIDIGGGTSDLTVYHEGMVKHTAVIPLGGGIITSDIKTGLNLMDKQAERLKVTYGSAIAEIEPENKIVTIQGISGRPPKEISCKTLAHIIQARMEEIINQLLYQIQASGFYEKLGAGIIVTGGGALLKNLPQLIAFKSGHEVRVGLPMEFIDCDLEKIPNINNPKYATAVGLLLKGTGFKENMNNKTSPYINLNQDIEPEPIVTDNRKKTEKEDDSKKASGRNKLQDLVQKVSLLFDVEDHKM